MVQALSGPLKTTSTSCLLTRAAGLNGQEAYKRLKCKRPDFKALFMSAYAANAIVHHGELDADVRFIQKPFEPDE